MKQLDALQQAKSQPWYSEAIFLKTWRENAGIRHAILTEDEVVGWGYSWEAALADANRRYKLQCGETNNK